MDAASVREGTLITCDVPTRELILHLNETHNFLLERLDDVGEGGIDEQRRLVETLQQEIMGFVEVEDELARRHVAGDERAFADRGRVHVALLPAAACCRP